VHRIAFLRSLFPRARFRVLHLTRNAAASINGLYDGWRFRGFHAHRIPGGLAMPGYTDHDAEGGATWWKFDLPPGWEGWTRRPLVEVCGFQWREAHRAVLSALEDPAIDRHRLRFEDAVGSQAARREAWEDLARWLGIPLDPGLTRLVECGLPPIMATTRPRHRRWFARADLLEPVLVHPDTTRIMEAIGYAPDRAGWT
jgi:hypothetical protein